MSLEMVPLLEQLRELYAVPRGMERFREYLTRLMGGSDDADLLPLVAANPMGREHVAVRVAALLDGGAEMLVAAAVAEANQRLAPPELWRVGLTVCDDLHGGWTNRTFNDLAGRMGSQAALKRRWVVVADWTTDPLEAAALHGRTLAAIYRMLHAARFGAPATLGALLRQEGRSMRFAGAPRPPLTPALAETRELLAVAAEASEYTELVPILYGDAAAAVLGYAPQGVAPGLAWDVALLAAWDERTTPAALLQ